MVYTPRPDCRLMEEKSQILTTILLKYSDLLLNDLYQVLCRYRVLTISRDQVSASD
jgi:hypothetical protein